MDLVPTRNSIHVESDSDWEEGLDNCTFDQTVPMSRLVPQLQKALELTLDMCRGRNLPNRFGDMIRTQRMFEYSPNEDVFPKTESGLPIYGQLFTARKVPRKGGWGRRVRTWQVWCDVWACYTHTIETTGMCSWSRQHVRNLAGQHHSTYPNTLLQMLYRVLYVFVSRWRNIGGYQFVQKRIPDTRYDSEF